MGIEVKQPTTISDGKGNIVVAHTTSQGLIVTDGSSTITIGFNNDQTLGIQISDGVTIFLSITKDGIILNDGSTDRVLIGKRSGGF